MSTLTAATPAKSRGFRIAGRTMVRSDRLPMVGVSPSGLSTIDVHDLHRELK